MKQKIKEKAQAARLFWITNYGKKAKKGLHFYIFLSWLLNKRIYDT